MIRILVVEDELISQEAIKYTLMSEYTLEFAESVSKAMSQIENRQFDLVLIDRGLPDGDGLILCDFIRSQPHLSMLPVIFLTGKAGEGDLVAGFHVGADDYIVKPFKPIELRARIQARLKKSGNSLAFEDVIVDLSKQKVFHRTKSMKEIPLTRYEFKVLALLLRNIERVYSRELILESVWGRETHVSDRVIDTHLSNLRKKLLETELCVEAVYKEGYRVAKKSTGVAS